MAKIEAVVKATGKKQMVPEHWIGHPTLGEPFKLTAQSRKRAEKEEALNTPDPDAAAPETGAVDKG